MPRKRHQRRTSAQWAGILRRFDSSGLGPREFCRREGLSLSSLQRWRSNSRATTREARFVALSAAAATATSPRSWALEIELPNGMLLRVKG